MDHSAIEAINKVTERYSRAGKKLHLRHLSEDCRVLLDNAASLIEISHWEDPHYTLPLEELESDTGKGKRLPLSALLNEEGKGLGKDDATPFQ